MQVALRQLGLYASLRAIKLTTRSRVHVCYLSPVHRGGPAPSSKQLLHAEIPGNVFLNRLRQGLSGNTWTGAELLDLLPEA